MNSKSAAVIEKLLRSKILSKISTYDPKAEAKPFYIRLFGKERLTIYSFLHSVITMLGSSVFEEIGVILLSENSTHVEKGYMLKGELSTDALIAADRIITELSRKQRVADISEETKLIRAVAMGAPAREYTMKIDLYFVRDGVENLIEMKTVKPNVRGFEDFKRTMLHWRAVRYRSGSENVRTYIALPYNPMAPEPYDIWQLRGVYDLKNELLVEDEFWTMLGGEGTFEGLLSIFERVGDEVRTLLEEKIGKLNEPKSTLF